MTFGLTWMPPGVEFGADRESEGGPIAVRKSSSKRFTTGALLVSEAPHLRFESINRQSPRLKRSVVQEVGA
jgi:hypothetical protein